MSVSFENSNTKINLMRAFAGESQARNRYTYAASTAKREGLNIVEAAFNFTANQEKEHAKVFFKLLKPFAEQTICIDADYPIEDSYSKTVDLLKSARNNEYEEFNSAYKNFSDEAKSEGFDNIANIFYEIAKVEKTHGDRFGSFIDLIENDKIFKNEAEITWICLNCGDIHIGKEPPETCVICAHPKGYFVRENYISLAQFK